jgi:hypothetical protein
MPWFKKRSDTPAKVLTDTSPNGVYSALRHQALSTNRSEAEIAVPPTDAPAWGILMETGYDEATVTLLALSSGTTISNGSVVIGGEGHESVLKANAAFLNRANHSLQYFEPCTRFLIPVVGHAPFFVLTDSGILTATALENDLGYGRHELSALFHAGHKVISQLRIISEASDG